MLYVIVLITIIGHINIMCNSLLILIVIVVMCNGRQRFKPGSSVTGSAVAQMAFSIFTMRIKPVMMTLVVVMTLAMVTPIMTASVDSDDV